MVKMYILTIQQSACWEQIFQQAICLLCWLSNQRRCGTSHLFVSLLALSFLTRTKITPGDIVVYTVTLLLEWIDHTLQTHT